MNRVMYFVLFAVACIFTSCEKDPVEMDVLVNRVGTLTVKAVDNNNKPLEKAKVEISYPVTDMSNFPKEMLLCGGLTNAEGIFSAGKVFQGTYVCRVYFREDYYILSAIQLVQVFPGKDNMLIINPYTMMNNRAKTALLPVMN